MPWYMEIGDVIHFTVAETAEGHPRVDWAELVAQDVLPATPTALEIPQPKTAVQEILRSAPMAPSSPPAETIAREFSPARSV